MTRRRWIFTAVAAAVAALLLFAYLHQRGLALGAADGTYAHDCCGTLRLDGGKMLLNGKQTVRYMVGRDAEGPYVLPRTYVGAFEDKGFEIDGTRPALRLRLDRLPVPTRILLHEGRARYVFGRERVRR